MTRASVPKILVALAALSCVSLPAMAQEEPVSPEDEIVGCYFGPGLMAGAVLTGEAEIADTQDALPELPTIEDDGR